MFETSTASPYFGLALEHNEKSITPAATKASNVYTWAQTASAQPYIAQVSEKLDVGTAEEKIAIRYQEMDQYGNLRRHYAQDYAAAGQHGAAFRDSSLTYLTNSTYTDAFLRNRVLTETAVVGGVSKPLRSYTYDQYSGSNPCYAGGFGLGIVDRGSWILEHDIAYNGSYTLRGNATRVDTLGAPGVCRKYDSLGNLSTGDGSA